MILGMDISTYVGMAQIGNDADQYKSKLLHFPGEKEFKRLQLIAVGVHNTVTEWNPEVICIEGYAIGNKFTRTEMVECGTVVRLELYRLKKRWYNVPPSVLKKFTTGKGNAKKPDMKAAVQERWGFISKSDDVIDAFALAKMGEQIHLHGTTNLNGVTQHGFGLV
jgi:Holliday junction resolvasome RuvABC endonuclease subunit